jgi:phytoene synthase
MIDAGSKSFAGAARLFDPTTRESAMLLYAWCRHCDDAIDGEHLGRRTRAGRGGHAQNLAELEARTRAALRGEPSSDPVFVALQRVAARHRIPERYPLELLEGFAMDVEGRRPETLEHLLLYCYHVAGVVGLMMAHVMEVQDDWALQRAADLGIALQLTNVARDVMDDARHGRVYLPLEWLAEAGVSPDEIAAPGERRRVARVVARLLDEAERFYASGEEGLRALPFRSAWAVAAARAVYREIGRLVRERGAGAWERRVIVSRPRKLARVAGAFVDAALAAGVGRFRACAPRPDLWRKRAPELD